MQSRSSAHFCEDLAQVSAVTGFAEPLNVGFEARSIDPALPESNFLQAGDLEALPIFDDADELSSVEQRIVRAGIEPGGTATEDFDVKFARLEIESIEVGDLEFTA